MPRPRAGYPAAWGNKRVTLVPVTGPSSYTQYTAPSTGGQTVQVGPVGGVKVVDFAIGAVTTDGLHRAEVVQIEASSVNGITVPRTRLRLKWYVVATGAEVAGAVNLSAKSVEIFVAGEK